MNLSSAFSALCSALPPGRLIPCPRGDGRPRPSGRSAAPLPKHDIRSPAPRFTHAHVGTAALGRPAERSSASESRYSLAPAPLYPCPRGDGRPRPSGRSAAPLPKHDIRSPAPRFYPCPRGDGRPRPSGRSAAPLPNHDIRSPPPRFYPCPRGDGRPTPVPFRLVAEHSQEGIRFPQFPQPNLFADQNQKPAAPAAGPSHNENPSIGSPPKNSPRCLHTHPENLRRAVWLRSFPSPSPTPNPWSRAAPAPSSEHDAPLRRNE